MGDDIVAITLVKDQLKLLTLHSDGSYEFADQTHQTHEILLRVARSSVLASPIATFERLLNDPRTREAQLQEFFEEHPRFLLGDQYSTIVPHLVLTQPTRGTLIPDFALRPHNPEGLCDLMELKLPSAKLIVGPPNRRRLTADVLEAAAQLREYRDYFDLPDNREYVARTYGLRLFKPRMIVVIGRRADFNEHELRSAEEDVPHLAITTYDDLLARAKSWDR